MPLWRMEQCRCLRTCFINGLQRPVRKNCLKPLKIARVSSAPWRRSTHAIQRSRGSFFENMRSGMDSPDPVAATSTDSMVLKAYAMVFREIGTVYYYDSVMAL